MDFPYPVGELLARWSLTALIAGLEEQLAVIQDAADQASRARSPRALAATQRQLLHTGIDSRIVVNDIIRYAQDRGWANDVLDFTEVDTAPQGRALEADRRKAREAEDIDAAVKRVNEELSKQWRPLKTAADAEFFAPMGGQIGTTEGDDDPDAVTRDPPTPHGEASPTASLAEILREGQITDGQRVSQLETDLREVLNTSAQLASASENIRLQRRVAWLTVIATIVAIIAAAAAVLALIHS